MFFKNGFICAIIAFFMDEFINEAGSLPESNEKAALIQGMKEVIGSNITEAVMPIIGKFSSLNPYGNSLKNI